MPIDLLADTQPVRRPDLLANEPQQDLLANEPQQESMFSKLPRNILAGLAGLGRRTAQLPGDLSRSAENLGDTTNDMMSRILGVTMPGSGNRKTSESIQGFVNQYIPPDFDYAKALGQSGDATMMDNIIQKSVEYSPELVGVGSLLRSGFNALPPLTKASGSKKLRMAEDLAKDSLSYISPERMEEASNFLPKTQATKEMMEGVQRGEYKPIFGLQSQVGHHARALEKSPLASERLLAPKVGEIKQLILNDLQTELRSRGNNEAANLLKNGIKDYAQFMKTRDLLKKYGIPTTGLAIIGLGLKKASKMMK